MNNNYQRVLQTNLPKTILQFLKKLSTILRNKINIYPNLMLFRNIFFKAGNIVLCASGKV